MKSIKSLLAATLITFATFSAYAQDGAFVLNHPDGAGCTIFGFGLSGVYVGPATIVVTPSGDFNAQCNAVLVDGVPEEDAVRINDAPLSAGDLGDVVCDLQVTPSGHLNLVNCDFAEF